MIYSEILKLPGYKKNYPQFGPVDVQTYFKNFNEEGLDLFLHLMALDPAKRISAKEALNHSFFYEIKPEDRAKLDI